MGTPMLEKLRLQGTRGHKAAGKRRTGSDAGWRPHAAELSARYLGGRAVPTSVRWVTNQNSRWGSATPSEGTIRLSHKLQPMPQWVMTMCCCTNWRTCWWQPTTRRFWRLLAAYPETERAKAFWKVCPLPPPAASRPGRATASRALPTTSTQRRARGPRPAESPSGLGVAAVLRRPPVVAESSAGPESSVPSDPASGAAVSNPPLSSFCRASSTSVSLASASFRRSLKPFGSSRSSAVGKGRGAARWRPGPHAAFFLKLGPQRGGLAQPAGAAVPGRRGTRTHVPPGRRWHAVAGRSRAAPPRRAAASRWRRRELVDPPLHERQGRLQLFQRLILGGGPLRHKDALRQGFLDALRIARIQLAGQLLDLRGVDVDAAGVGLDRTEQVASQPWHLDEEPAWAASRTARKSRMSFSGRLRPSPNFATLAGSSAISRSARGTPMSVELTTSAERAPIAWPSCIRRSPRHVLQHRGGAPPIMDFISSGICSVMRRQCVGDAVGDRFRQPLPGAERFLHPFGAGPGPADQSGGGKFGDLVQPQFGKPQGSSTSRD